MLPSRSSVNDQGFLGQSPSSAGFAAVEDMTMGEVLLYWIVDGIEGRRSERATAEREEIIRI